jgi:hypothetical protein
MSLIGCLRDLGQLASQMQAPMGQAEHMQQCPVWLVYVLRLLFAPNFG